MVYSDHGAVAKSRLAPHADHIRTALQMCPEDVAEMDKESRIGVVKRHAGNTAEYFSDLTPEQVFLHSFLRIRGSETIESIDKNAKNEQADRSELYHEFVSKRIGFERTPTESVVCINAQVVQDTLHEVRTHRIIKDAMKDVDISIPVEINLEKLELTDGYRWNMEGDVETVMKMPADVIDRHILNVCKFIGVPYGHKPEHVLAATNYLLDTYRTRMEINT